MHEVVDEWRALTDLEALDALSECSEDAVPFQARKALADAGVNPVAPRHLPGVVARDVEAVGLVPEALVAVGRGVGNHQVRPGWHPHAVDLGVALDAAAKV